MAGSRLPLGLTRYAGKRFEQLHDAGCGCITASNIPDLFGVGRNGKLALAAHVLGVMPIEIGETELTRRGKMLQPIVGQWYHEDTGVHTKIIHAWKKHPKHNYYVSPDALCYVDGLEARPRPGEIKVVAEPVFDMDWESNPPNKVLLQHQAQLDITDSDSGPVIACKIGDFRFDIHHWMVERNRLMVELIEDECQQFLDLIGKKELPPPDMGNVKDQDAFIKLAKVMEGMSIQLDDEVGYLIRKYNRSGLLKNLAEKRQKECKARLIEALNGAQYGYCGSKRVEFKIVEMSGHVIKPHPQRRIYITNVKKDAK